MKNLIWEFAFVSGICYGWTEGEEEKEELLGEIIGCAYFHLSDLHAFLWVCTSALIQLPIDLLFLFNPCKDLQLIP